MDEKFWNHVNNCVDWLNEKNGCDREEVTNRILKLTEEVGEVAQARIGMLGQNPRKGVTHTVGDVGDELCDVMLTAAVAIASIVDFNAEMVMEDYIERRSARLEKLR